jgi:subtilisin family serine protease
MSNGDESYPMYAILRCLEHAKVNNIDIINASIGRIVDVRLADYADEMSYITDFCNAGGLFVASAGNDGKDLDLKYDPDFEDRRTPDEKYSEANGIPIGSTYRPAGYPQECIISVTGIEMDDTFDPHPRQGAGYNYGKFSVDLAAPTGVWTTYRRGLGGALRATGYSRLDPLPGAPNHGFMWGSSAATPHVSGVAALLKALHPGWTGLQIKEAILNTVDKLPSLQDRVVMGGRLNLAAAMKYVLPKTQPQPQVQAQAQPAQGSRITVGTSSTPPPGLQA